MFSYTVTVYQVHNVNEARTGSSQENKKNKDESDVDPPTFTEFLEYILHEDMTGACKEGRQTDRQWSV